MMLISFAFHRVSWVGEERVELQLVHREMGKPEMEEIYAEFMLNFAAEPLINVIIIFFYLFLF